MDFWTWVTTTTSPDSWLTTLGVTTLAALFATDRILTRGQHDRRTADLVKHHERELTEKDARLLEVKESRDGWKAVALKERENAHAAAVGAAEAATSAIVDVRHVLESLDEALDGREGRQ